MLFSLQNFIYLILPAHPKCSFQISFEFLQIRWDNFFLLKNIRNIDNEKGQIWKGAKGEKRDKVIKVKHIKEDRIFFWIYIYI